MPRTSSAPPWLSMMVLQMESPIPIPPCLVVWNGLKMRSLCPGATLIPASRTSMRKRYAWPGNIRELENVIERWTVIGDCEHISMDESWLPRDPTPALEAAPEPFDESVDLHKHVEELERKLIGRMMNEVGGNQSEAARRLGLSRASLIERLKRYGPLTG